MISAIYNFALTTGANRVIRGARIEHVCGDPTLGPDKDYAYGMRIVTTALDGRVRLYAPDFRLIGRRSIPGGEKPISVKYAPDGQSFAVGFIDNGPASDTQTFTDVEIATPVDCAAEQFLFTLTIFPVLHGNVVVDSVP